MRTHAATLLAALCGAVLAALLGCKDTGVIGDRQAALECEPACAADQSCDRALGMCIPSCDDCEVPVDAGEACDDSDDQQCVEDAAVCGEGGCSECEEDSDCDGEGSRECQDGRCVETGDEDESEEEYELPDF